MPKFKRPKLIGKLQDNLLDLAFSVYRFGHQQAIEGNKKFTFPEFCRRIKQIHETGNEIRIKQSKGDYVNGITDLKGHGTQENNRLETN